MAAKVPTTEIGKASAGMIVAETLRRNSRMTRMTRAPAMSRVTCTSWMLSLIETLRSYSVLMLIDAGNLAWKLGKVRLIELTVSIVLAPGWRWMARTIARWSTFQVATRLFSTLSIGVATSSRRTGAPLRQATVSAR